MKRYNRRYTGIVDKLETNDVFVYAGDPQGKRIPKSRMDKSAKQFGAAFGVQHAEGMTSKCTYAIPCYRSYGTPEDQSNLNLMRQSVEKFIHYAEMHPEQRFLVTQIGVSGVFKQSVPVMAPMFRDAIAIENILLPVEFVMFLEREDETGVFNIMLISSDSNFIKKCKTELATDSIRIVKELGCGLELEEFGRNLVNQDNLSRQIDAVVYDPAVPESLDNPVPFSGLNGILSMETAVNYNIDIPFFCLSSLPLDDIRSQCGLSGRLLQRIEKAYYPMMYLKNVQEVILNVDSKDSRIRKEHYTLLEAAEWYDSIIRPSDEKRVVSFVSSVLRDNTTDLINRTRSFLHEIIGWLISRGALPKDAKMNPGAYLDLIRDGVYNKSKTIRYYMVAGNHEIPKRLRFMLEAVKENGNVGSHSTSPLDRYINQSVFFAFCSFLLWLYEEREFFLGKVENYYAEQDSRKRLQTPFEGIISVASVDGRDYYYCGNVHLDTDKGQSLLSGSPIIVHSVSYEKRPRLMNVTFYADKDQWSIC